METAPSSNPPSNAVDFDDDGQHQHQHEHLPSSEIVNFYKNKSIFLTGGTGFLGKVLIEKLLRTCHDLNKIYVLVRAKKGHTAAQRLNEMLNCQVSSLARFDASRDLGCLTLCCCCWCCVKKLFDTVSQYYPDFRSKLEPIQGDLCEPNLGITEEEEKKLIENVEIVFHSAATVRFDEPLKMAVEQNIIGTKKVIDLTKKMKNLKVIYFFVRRLTLKLMEDDELKKE